METRATMRPGQKGTKKLVRRFGERLIFVRYRYDAAHRKRFTTVELIVDEADWAPSVPPIVHLQISYAERDLQRRVRAAGGRWDHEARAWLLKADRAQALGLQDRIRPPAVGKGLC
jgi:hypothetical protein